MFKKFEAKVDNLLREFTESFPIESQNSTVDLKSKKCEKCKKGNYIETSIHDDIDGVLHCNKCNHQVARYKVVKQVQEKKGARCTKVTGQQTSTRSDKKYMRCTRVGGELKRVHYGDPNLRIKKSNPKRRKSFRARHKCSTAKPGTAKYFSCKNW